MIIDLPRFIAAGRPLWAELERELEALAAKPHRALTLEQAQRFHFLYQKVSADLGRVSTFASEPELRRHLESLVARAYAEIHATHDRGVRWHPLRWLFITFPATFRRHIRAFVLALLVTLLGAGFGALGLLLEAEAKAAIVPAQFAHVLQDPAERVRQEEEEGRQGDHLAGRKASFAAQLMQNNIGVCIKAMALGLTWGLGTIVMLFYNGVLLGLVGADFIAAGQTVFLLGWLLPHGSFELPAIFIGGQAGLVLARAMFGRGDRLPLAARLRVVAPDVATLIGGAAVLLVWAGIVESYFSQYHQPRLSYAFKITFGVLELAVLTAFLSSAWWWRKTKEAV
jgi:uncharacterized membrane protein SpoIIM required for sporulation